MWVTSACGRFRWISAAWFSVASFLPPALLTNGNAALMCCQGAQHIKCVRPSVLGVVGVHASCEEQWIVLHSIAQSCSCGGRCYAAACHDDGSDACCSSTRDDLAPVLRCVGVLHPRDCGFQQD